MAQISLTRDDVADQGQAHSREERSCDRAAEDTICCGTITAAPFVPSLPLVMQNISSHSPSYLSLWANSSVNWALFHSPIGRPSSLLLPEIISHIKWSGGHSNSTSSAPNFVGHFVPHSLTQSQADRRPKEMKKNHRESRRLDGPTTHYSIFCSAFYSNSWKLVN